MRNETSDVNVQECKNCNNHFQGTYCDICGQKVINERYTLKHLFNLTLDSFNVQKGLFYTAKMLFKNPGNLINEYLNGRSKDIYNPLKYLILIASVNALLMLWFNIFETNIANTNELLGEQPEGNKLQQLVSGYIKTYLNVFALLVLPFYSLVSKWVFKKYRLYYAEHLIINGYLFAQYLVLQMTLYLIFAAIPGFSKFSMAFSVIVFISYYTYSFRGVFKIRFFRSLLNSIVIYFLGFLLFMLFIVLVFVVVIVIMKLNGYDLKDLIQQ